MNGLIVNGALHRIFTREMVNMETQKVWLVCGADGGLGEATVKFLLLREQQVIAILSPGTGKEKTLHLYHAKFPNADLRVVNIFDAPDTEAAVRQIVRQYGRIDRLINIGDGGLLGMHVLPVMQDRGRGHIIQLIPDECHDQSPEQPTTLKMRYEADDAGGIHYTFLGPDLCFQSMLVQEPNHKKQNKYQ
ncbi:MAG: SDR family NAD(P)-dependent oxidoreductase [Chitinophagaceae bacterium]